MKPPKTWTERLGGGKEHEVKPAPINIAGMKAGQIMLVPSARLVDAFIRTVPRGRSMTVKEFRNALAAAHGAQITCPITTGFHLRTVAEALGRGVPIDVLTPVWRVLPTGSPTLPKLSFDARFIVNQRALESLDEADGAAGSA